MGKLTAIFESMSGMQYELSIENSQITTGTITLSSDPLHLKSPDYDTKYPGLRSTELEINILTNTDLFELYTTDPLGTKVTLTEDGELIFVGFIEPNQYSMPCTPGVINEMQVVAIDALSAMKNVYMTERKAMSVQGWMSEMNDIIGISNLSYTPMVNGADIVSNDALMPTDLYADGIDEKFGTYGELLEEIGKCYDYTIMLIGNQVKYLNIDDVGTSGSVSNIISATMEIVNPYRYITAKFDKYPDIDQPDILDKSSPTGIIWATDSSGKRKTIDGNYCALWYAKSYAEKYWTKYNWQSPLSLPSPIIGLNYSTNVKDVSCDEPGWIVGISGISTKIRPIVSVGPTSISIECDVHINGQFESNFDAIPRLWKDTKKEGTGSTSTIALLVNGSVVDPTGVTTDFYDNETSNQAWQRCVYTFTNIASRHFNIIVRSPQASSTSGRGYHYAKNFKIHYTTDEDLNVRVSAAGGTFGDDLSIGCKLNTMKAQSHGLASYSSRTTDELMNAMAAQYSAPRRKVSLTHKGYVTPMSSVTLNGVKYNVVSFDNDLMNETQAVTLLESGVND